MIEEKLKQILVEMKPALDSSMDCVCVVDIAGQVIYCNTPMRAFLGLRNRELGKKPVFCDLIKLSACDSACQIDQVIQTGAVVRLDESPASKGKDKLRVSLRALPLFDEDGSKRIGAIITLRDTTGEVLLQAKYHKLLEIAVQKDAKIAELDEKIQALQLSMRKARVGVVGK